MIDPLLPSYVGMTIAEVQWVQTPAEASLARDALLAADVLGFDTESRPTFRKGEVSTGPHLIQLATEQGAYLFPVAAVAEPACQALLAEVLGSTHILKAGFGLRDDLRRLKSKLGIESRNVFDLAVALRTERRKDVGAKTAVASLFGQRLQKSKSISTTNWSRLPLTERQLLYAADDAQVALRVYRRWVVLGNSPRAAGGCDDVC